NVRVCWRTPQKTPRLILGACRQMSTADCRRGRLDAAWRSGLGRVAVEHRVQLAAQAGEAVAEPLALAVVLLAQVDELVRHADCREHRQALEAGRLGMGAQLAHLAVEVAGGLEQAVALFRRAGDQEFAIDESQRDRFTAGHGFYQPLLSSDFSRWIIASTRLRACSLRASRPARSPDNCSWLWRRLRFSSLSRRTVSSRWSSCRPRAANSCWTGSTWSGVLMRETIAGRRRKSVPRST